MAKWASAIRTRVGLILTIIAVVLSAVAIAALGASYLGKAMGTWLGAIGTLMAVVWALFGERIRAWLHPPNLMLGTPDGPPDLVMVSPPRYYVHLKLCNAGGMARNCRVMLQAVRRKCNALPFVAQFVPIPLQLTWSPSEMPPLQRDVAKQTETLDLGFVEKPGGKLALAFHPQFYVTPAGHDYSTPPGVVGRYFLEVAADGYVAPQQVFEVVWDGAWDDDPERMQNHLSVTKVPLSQAGNAI